MIAGLRQRDEVKGLFKRYLETRHGSGTYVAAGIPAGQLAPTIDPQYLSTEYDRETFRAAFRIARRVGAPYARAVAGHFDPVTFDAGCVKAVRDAAERLGYSHRDIVSGAGHDACWINRVAPTAMIMCPCKDGLSHNEAEEILPEWAEKGANVLFHAVVETAGIVE